MIEERGCIWKKHEKGYFIAVTTNGVVKADGTCVMGKGIALQAAQKFPTLPEKLGYKLRRSGNHVYAFLEIRILSFPTKHDWRDPSSLSLIKQSCEELVAILHEYNIDRLYMTRPGCGNGRLDWNDVKPILEGTLDDRFIIV